MSVVGTSTEWADLIDPMVPEILNLVTASWEEIPLPTPDEKEDDITIALCRALKQNRTARKLMFQIDTQQVELEPLPGQDLGRLDISFRPLIPREDIYFCFGRDGCLVYKAPPTIDLILGADDHLIGIAIYRYEALGFLDLFRQIIDGHGLRLSDSFPAASSFLTAYPPK